MNLRTSLLLLVPLAAALVASCGRRSSDDGAPTTGALSGGLCRVVDVQRGTVMSEQELHALGDPVAKLILSAEGGCPESFRDISQKLRKTDTVNCADTSGAAPAGVTTRFVSETAQILGVPTRYRAVTSRACGGRSTNELLFSFGLAANAADVNPGSLEVIGETLQQKDGRVSGVFNFYAREAGEWRFFGTSADFVRDGYTCDANGACTSRAAKKTRCASCHTGGGLVMKELNNPWVHWEEDKVVETPGAAALAKTHEALLGTKKDGIDMEALVKTGNRQWTLRRLEELKAKGVAELLRPLFCTLDINLQSTGTPQAPAKITKIPSNFLVDERLGAPSFIVNDADYTALLASPELDQRIGSLTKAGAPVRDTFFAFTYVEKSELDQQLIELLVDPTEDDDSSDGIVDAEFLADVVAVDFTRPIFSKARCDLLAFAPTLAAPNITKANVLKGFVENLSKDTSKLTPAAATFLSHLVDPKKTADAHKKTVADFAAACAKRAPKDFLKDVLVYASNVRTKARNIRSADGSGIIEFDETMASDRVTPSSGSFDPQDCTLK